MNGPIMPPHGVRRRARLPSPIRTLLRKLPHVPSSVVVAAALNLMVRKRLPVEVFEQLADRPFRIEVCDMDLVMAFRFSRRRFVAVPCTGEATLRFRVYASDFATLAAPGETSGGRFPSNVMVVGNPGMAVEVRRALDGIDVARTRRILRRAVRRVECERARA